MIKKLFRKRIIIIACIVLAALSYSFYASDAISYINDDPQACTNCHVMDEHYVAWEKTKHPKKIDCNQCHLPNKNPINKNYHKTVTGIKHSTNFLFSKVDTVCLKENSKTVIIKNCVRCHAEYLMKNDTTRKFSHQKHKDRLCWDCHKSTGHKRETKM